MKVFIASIDPVETIIIFYYNESQLKNPDISGAIFTLSLSIPILKCLGAPDMSGFRERSELHISKIRY